MSFDPPRNSFRAQPARRFLIGVVDARFHFGDGGIDGVDGVIAMPALVVPGDFQFVAGGAEVIQSGIHVRLARPRVLDENAAGGHDSEGEGENEMSEVEFHSVNLRPLDGVASKIALAKTVSFFVTFQRENGSLPFFMALLFANNYPYAIALVFLACLYAMDVPQKGSFALRALVALAIATFLAHVNRIFHLWPSHLLFPSGHTTFCFGLSLSLAMLRPWTLAITLPLLAVLGVSMVSLHFHTTLDILGAIPLVLIVYGVIHKYWRVSPRLLPAQAFVREFEPDGKAGKLDALGKEAE